MITDKRKKDAPPPMETSSKSNTYKQNNTDWSGRSQDGRARNFATVVYPESAPDEWQSKLAECFVPSFISPLHDKDVNPTGEPKKPHYHVVLMFEGKKSLEQVRAITEQIGGVGCEVVNSIRGYARYLCHMDNPEKHQYAPEDVRSLCGADYTGTIGLVTDKYKAIKEMIAFCRENNIVAYCDLLEYCAEERMDWFRVLCDNGTVVVKEYLKSKTWAWERRVPEPTIANENQQPEPTT